jgi:hypothetical protein
MVEPSGIHRMERYAVLFAGFCLVIGLFSGCSDPVPGVKDLEERARQYMETRQRRDWAQIYDEFIDPAGRARLDRQEFLRSRGGGFEILGYEVVFSETEEGSDPASGQVRIKIDAMIPLLAPGGGTKTVRRDLEDSQSWVFREGRWFVRLRR